MGPVRLWSSGGNAMQRGGTGLAAVLLLVALAASGVAQAPKQKPKAKADFGLPLWVREPIEGKHLHYLKFPSKAVGGDVSYVIYRPACYDEQKDRRFPVVYWLHGIGGSQAGLPRFAERWDAAIEGGKAPPMLVVFANGVRNSFYCDATDGSRPVETTIVKELVPHID